MVSAVLHMDEETPHLHATVIPIVTGERRKAKSEQGGSKRKYRKKSADTVRLCADDVLTRDKLIAYHDSYAQAMEKYGLQRGVRGSEARHTTTLQYYRELKKKNTEMESGLQVLQERKTDAEKELQQVKNEIRTDRLKGATTTAVTNIAESVGSLFGSNKFKQLEKENRQLNQDITYRDEDIGTLQHQLQAMESEHSRQILEMQRQHSTALNDAIAKKQATIELFRGALQKAAIWYPMFPQMLKVEGLCKSVGFNDEQTARLMKGKPLTYSGELYSEEHNRKIKVNDTVFTAVIDKGKLVLAVGSQHIGDWFKEQIEKANRMGTRQQIKSDRGFKL